MGKGKAEEIKVGIILGEIGKFGPIGENWKISEKLERGCYISCRDAPPIMTAIILDENAAN